MSVDQSVNVALDLEREFLSHLVDQDALEYTVRDGISTELLYTPKHKAIFNFAQHYLNETKKAPTRAVFETEFVNFEVGEPQSSIEWVVAKLRDRYQSNQVQDMAWSLADKINEPTKAMDFLREKMVEVERNSMSTKHIWAAGDHGLFLSQLQDEIQAGQYQGLPIGFGPVDLFTGGLKPGYLAFLAARPKRQKTFFILNAFIEQKRAGYRPILFTLENTEKEIMLRISCMLSGYPWDLAHRGHIDHKGWKLLRESWEEFDALGEHWISRPPMDQRSVSAMMLEADKFDADSIILSQFKWIQPMSQYKRPDHEKHAEIVMDLKGAATRAGSERPILVEAQLNREGESIEDFMDIGLGQLGLTDAIGQVSDVVYALYQNKDMRAQGHTQFGIIEARNHDKKNWYVRSEFKNTTYMELVS